MKSFPASTTAALAAGVLVQRFFLWLTAKDRATGNPVTIGLWSDVGDVSAEVLDGQTGAAVTRNYIGSGGLIGIDAIPLVNDVTVRNVQVTTSALASAAQEALQQYDPDQAPAEIHYGLLDPNTRNLVGPAECIFVGFIDSIEFTIAKEGGDSQAVITLASQTAETTRMNPDVRSDASQQVRAPGDTFYEYTAVVGDWTIFWGKKSEKVNDQSFVSKFSDIAK